MILELKNQEIVRCQQILELHQVKKPIERNIAINHPKTIILGNNGTGKTYTILTWIINQNITEREKVFIYIEGSTFNQEKTLIEWISKYIKKVHKINQKLIKQWLKEQKIIPVFDEIEDSNKKKKEQIFKLVLKNTSLESMIICGKEIPHYDEWSETEIQPLTEKEIYNYLNNNCDISKININLKLLEKPRFLNMVVNGYKPNQPFKMEKILSENFKTRLSWKTRQEERKIRTRRWRYQKINQEPKFDRTTEYLEFCQLLKPERGMTLEEINKLPIPIPIKYQDLTEITIATILFTIIAIVYQEINLFPIGISYYLITPNPQEDKYNIYQNVIPIIVGSLIGIFFHQPIIVGSLALLYFGQTKLVIKKIARKILLSPRFIPWNQEKFLGYLQERKIIIEDKGKYYLCQYYNN